VHTKPCKAPTRQAGMKACQHINARYHGETCVVRVYVDVRVQECMCVHGCICPCVCAFMCVCAGMAGTAKLNQPTATPRQAPRVEILASAPTRDHAFKRTSRCARMCTHPHLHPHQHPHTHTTCRRLSACRPPCGASMHATRTEHTTQRTHAPCRAARG